jgi:pyrroline-5-carboxylate reductase
MKIAVIGCGVMGSAFAKHFAREHSLLLCDVDRKRAALLSKEVGGEISERFHEAVQEAEVVLLAVKPKDLADVAKSTASSLSNRHLLISVLAGTPLSMLKKYYPEATILRIMPNLALTCAQGVIGLVGENLSQEMKSKGEYLLQGLGLLAWLSEDKIEALAALAASGPAFVFVLIEAMIESGICMGFTAKEAREFVIKMMEGAIALLRESGKHPAELKLEVASPAGMTIAGLREMETMRVRAGILNTFLAAYEKSFHLEK